MLLGPLTYCRRQIKAFNRPLSALRRSLFFCRNLFELQDICLVPRYILADWRAIRERLERLYRFRARYRGKEEVSFFSFTLHSVLYVNAKRYHGPLRNTIACSRVFRFSSTLETTRDYADNIWCSLCTYMFCSREGIRPTKEGA